MIKLKLSSFNFFLFAESWASKETIEELLSNLTTVPPTVESDFTETTTLSLITLDDLEDNLNTTFIDTTLLPNLTLITETKSSSTKNQSFKFSNATISSFVTTEDSINLETTIPNTSIDTKLEEDENAELSEIITAPSESKNNNETNTNNIAKITVEETTKPLNDQIDNESDLSPDKISKRILISSTPESNGNPKILDDFPGEHLDSWRPMGSWSLPDENFDAANPTIRFPLSDSFYPTDESSPRKTRESYSILKEPVTAYYFDLASVIPEQPSGPLFDPRILETKIHGHPSKINEPIDTLQDDLKFFDDTRPLVSSKAKLDSQNLRPTIGAITPTPTLTRTVNTADENSLISNINLEDALTPNIKDVASLQNFDPTTTIASNYDNTIDYKKSTPAYTLGHSTDFYFTHEESNFGEKTTNTPGSDILSSSLSSDQPLEIQKWTGDQNYKSKERLTTALPFEIPIRPTDLPSPISLSSVIKTQSNKVPTLTLMTRIPLWKRISQRKSLSELSVSKTSNVDIFSKTILPSTTSSTTQNNIAIEFENDIPIGILSPGILKYPARASDDNSIKEDSDIIKDKNFVSSDILNTSFTHFTASPTIPTLDSSMQSSTPQENKGKPQPPISIITSKTVNNNFTNQLNISEDNLAAILPSSVNSSFSSSNNLENTETIKTKDYALRPDFETTTNVNIPSRVLLNNSSLHLNGEFMPPMPVNNQSIFLEPNVDIKLAPKNESFLIAPTHAIKNNFTSANAADDAINIHKIASSSEDFEHPHPIVNEINSSSVEDKPKIDENAAENKTLKENRILHPSLFNNVTSLSDNFDHSTENSTNNQHLHRNDSTEASQPKNKTEPFVNSEETFSTSPPLISKY